MNCIELPLEKRIANITQAANQLSALVAEKKSEKTRRPYQAPELIMLEAEKIRTGGINVPENSSGQLS